MGNVDGWYTCHVIGIIDSWESLDQGDGYRRFHEKFLTALVLSEVEGSRGLFREPIWDLFVLAP